MAWYQWRTSLAGERVRMLGRGLGSHVLFPRHHVLCFCTLMRSYCKTMLCAGESQTQAWEIFVGCLDPSSFQLSQRGYLDGEVQGRGSHNSAISFLGFCRDQPVGEGGMCTRIRGLPGGNERLHLFSHPQFLDWPLTQQFWASVL